MYLLNYFVLKFYCMNYKFNIMITSAFFFFNYTLEQTYFSSIHQTFLQNLRSWKTNYSTKLALHQPNTSKLEYGFHLVYNLSHFHLLHSFLYFHCCERIYSQSYYQSNQVFLDSSFLSDLSFLSDFHHKYSFSK